MILCICNTPNIPHSSVDLAAGFHTDVLSILDRKSQSSQDAAAPMTRGAYESAGGTVTASAATKQPNAAEGFNSPIALPQINEIARPEDLMKRPPYFLSVRQTGSTRVVGEGSHHESLSLMMDYLQKWARPNPNYSNRVSFILIYLG